MLRKLLRDETFFDQLDLLAKTLQEGCGAIVELFENFADVPEKAKRIKAIEHAADLIVHDFMEQLSRSMFPPFKRDALRRLVRRMDDVLDMTEAVSERLWIYEIRSIPAGAKELARTLVASADGVAKAILALRNLGDGRAILQDCIEINRIENEADAQLRHALGGLFRNERDPVLILKWKELYETLESATDRCEDVADVIQEIVQERTRR